VGLFSLRKAFTVSERVAIADAVAERLRGRAGNPELRSNSGNISGIESGETRDLAAAKAGLGSGKRSSPDKPTPSKPLLQKP
jgi:hypothetical protein